MRGPDRPAAEHVGDIAIVLHSHMPYVEGFGTYPFGEEWLFDALARSYLPVLAIADAVTVTVTPVLADQLEAPGVAERLRRFVRELRLRSAELDAADMEGEALRDACLAEAARYAEADRRLEALGDELPALFAAPAQEGRIELVPSAATHAILPLICTRGARLMQIETGLRSHRRRFGPARGFWLPECAYEPGLEHLLAEGGVGWFCTDQSRSEGSAAALVPIAAGELVAFPIDWEAVSWLWSLEGYPSYAGYADFHRKSLRGTRPWSIGGEPYVAAAAAEWAAGQASEFARAVAARLRAHRERTGAPGLLTFAIDTELLGHWWWEGPGWLARVLEELPGHGVRAVRLSEAALAHPAEARPLHRSSWGEEKDLRTWEGPPVADLAWGVRRLELRLLRELGAGRLRGPRLDRAARELLAVQSSDWAFLDYRRQAGDYPWQRILGHAEAAFEAIDCAGRVEPELRSLAPDLCPAPLLEP